MPLKSVLNDLLISVKKNWEIVLVILIAIIVIVVFLVYSSKSKASSSEYFYYNNNKLDKATILSLLSKPCLLSIRDYVNILNSTDNLNTLFLQEICNNNVCPGYNPSNNTEILKLIKTISGSFIIKCIQTNDLYRLALVNLKINYMISSFIPNYPLFKRALTKGVYGVESINIYLNKEQQDIQSIVNLYNEKLPKLHMDDGQLSNSINNLGLDENDGNLYKSFIKDFINKMPDKDLLNNQDNASMDFSVPLFAKVASVTLFPIFTTSSVKCS
jgi:hypothetical protein